MRTIEEKNGMIANFMGVKFKDDNEYINELKEMRSNGIFFEQEYMASELKYHSSWDWLMPVVEEIESLGFNVEKNFQPIDKDFQCLITKGNDILFQEFNEYSITAMHYVVVEFIEFYNKKTSWRTYQITATQRERR